MELKKNQKANLQRKRILFLEVGMIISLCAVIGAFTWNQKDRVIVKPVSTALLPEADMVINTRTPENAQKTKILVNLNPDFINVVKDNARIERDENPFDPEGEGPIIVLRVKEKPTVEEPVLIPDTKAIFLGGDPAVTFRNWVLERLEYPVVPHETGVQGRVTIAFVVEKDGSLTNFEVMQSPDAALSEEAMRVIKSSPKWTAAIKNNKLVRLRFILPVEFRLQ